MRTMCLLMAAACAEPATPSLVIAGQAPAVTGGTDGGNAPERLLLTGRLQAVSSVDLTTPRTRVWNVSLRWLAEDGAQVKTGDRVAELDNSAFTGDLEEKKLV